MGDAAIAKSLPAIVGTGVGYASNLTGDAAAFVAEATSFICRSGPTRKQHLQRRARKSVGTKAKRVRRNRLTG